MIDLTNAELPSDIKRYTKKPIPVRAMQISEEFIVDTLEGRHTGKAGDYLMIGIRGERYPCDREIFEESYEEVKA